MLSVRPCPLPDGALLARYRVDGAHADCYAVDVPGRVSHAQYVTAFYTTPVFKLERLILNWAVSRPSTDAQAEQLAAGSISDFAAWHVESRDVDQLLLADLRGTTRSWLMVAPLQTAQGTCTRLYFGSAVVPVRRTGTGDSTIAPVFRALLGFHKIYSVLLLYAAKLRLGRQASR